MVFAPAFRSDRGVCGGWTHGDARADPETGRFRPADGQEGTLRNTALTKNPAGWDALGGGWIGWPALRGCTSFGVNAASWALRDMVLKDLALRGLAHRGLTLIGLDRRGSAVIGGSVGADSHDGERRAGAL